MPLSRRSFVALAGPVLAYFATRRAHATQCRNPQLAHVTALRLDNRAFCLSFIVSKRGGLGGL
jgi:hypothetical protein